MFAVLAIVLFLEVSLDDVINAGGKKGRGKSNVKGKGKGNHKGKGSCITHCDGVENRLRPWADLSAQKCKNISWP